MKKILGLAIIALLIATQATAAITLTNTITAGPYSVGGNSVETVGELNLAGTYATGGFTFSGDNCGVSHIQSLIIQGEDGYQFWFNPSTGKVLVFQTATVTPSGTISTPTFSGVNATISPTAALAGAPVFSGANATISPTAALAGAPVFTGVGHTATVYVVDQTPTVGYSVYFDPATGKLNYYNSGAGNVAMLSETFTPAGTNSAPAITVTGASYTPAGTNSAPSITVTGASYTPAGTISTATFTGAATTAAALAEVGAGTSLANVDKVDFVCKGW